MLRVFVAVVSTSLTQDYGNVTNMVLQKQITVHEENTTSPLTSIIPEQEAIHIALNINENLTRMYGFFSKVYEDLFGSAMPNKLCLAGYL